MSSLSAEGVRIESLRDAAQFTLQENISSAGSFSAQLSSLRSDLSGILSDLTSSFSSLRASIDNLTTQLRFSAVSSSNPSTLPMPVFTAPSASLGDIQQASMASPSFAAPSFNVGGMLQGMTNSLSSAAAQISAAATQFSSSVGRAAGQAQGFSQSVGDSMLIRGISAAGRYGAQAFSNMAGGIFQYNNYIPSNESTLGAGGMSPAMQSFMGNVTPWDLYTSDKPYNVSSAEWGLERSMALRNRATTLGTAAAVGAFNGIITDLPSMIVGGAVGKRVGRALGLGKTGLSIAGGIGTLGAGLVLNELASAYTDRVVEAADVYGRDITGIQRLGRRMGQTFDRKTATGIAQSLPQSAYEELWGTRYDTPRLGEAGYRSLLTAGMSANLFRGTSPNELKTQLENGAKVVRFLTEVMGSRDINETIDYVVRTKEMGLNLLQSPKYAQTLGKAAQRYGAFMGVSGGELVANVQQHANQIYTAMGMPGFIGMIPGMQSMALAHAGETHGWLSAADLAVGGGHLGIGRTLMGVQANMLQMPSIGLPMMAYMMNNNGAGLNAGRTAALLGSNGPSFAGMLSQGAAAIANPATYAMMQQNMPDLLAELGQVKNGKAINESTLAYLRAAIANLPLYGKTYREKLSVTAEYLKSIVPGLDVPSAKLLAQQLIRPEMSAEIEGQGQRLVDKGYTESLIARTSGGAVLSSVGDWFNKLKGSWNYRAIQKPAMAIYDTLTPYTSSLEITEGLGSQFTHNTDVVGGGVKLASTMDYLNTRALDVAGSQPWWMTKNLPDSTAYAERLLGEGGSTMWGTTQEKGAQTLYLARGMATYGGLNEMVDSYNNKAKLSELGSLSDAYDKGLIGGDVTAAKIREAYFAKHATEIKGGMNTILEFVNNGALQAEAQGLAKYSKSVGPQKIDTNESFDSVKNRIRAAQTEGIANAAKLRESNAEYKNLSDSQIGYIQGNAILKGYMYAKAGTQRFDHRGIPLGTGADTADYKKAEAYAKSNEYLMGAASDSTRKQIADLAVATMGGIPGFDQHIRDAEALGNISLETQVKLGGELMQAANLGTEDLANLFGEEGLSDPDKIKLGNALAREWAGSKSISERAEQNKIGLLLYNGSFGLPFRSSDFRSTSTAAQDASSVNSWLKQYSSETSGTVKKLLDAQHDSQQQAAMTKVFAKVAASQNMSVEEFRKKIQSDSGFADKAGASITKMLAETTLEGDKVALGNMFSSGMGLTASEGKKLAGLVMSSQSTSLQDVVKGYEDVARKAGGGVGEGLSEYSDFAKKFIGRDMESVGKLDDKMRKQLQETYKQTTGKDLSSDQKVGEAVKKILGDATMKEAGGLKSKEQDAIQNKVTAIDSAVSQGPEGSEVRIYAPRPILVMNVSDKAADADSYMRKTISNMSYGSEKDLENK